MKSLKLWIFMLGLIGCLHDPGQAVMAQTVWTVNADEFEQKLVSSSDYQLIDVRTAEEFKSGHLQGAVNINFYDNDFSNQLNQLNKEKEAFVYCKAGSRSSMAIDQMKEMGFKKIFELQGGIVAWTKSGKPIENYVATSDKFTNEDFQRLILSEQIVVIDFYAPWCLPCKKMEPVLDSLSEEFKGKILISRVNIEEAKAVTRQLGISEIPVLNGYKKGDLFSSVNGYQSEAELRTIIRKLLQ